MSTRNSQQAQWEQPLKGGAFRSRLTRSFSTWRWPRHRVAVRHSDSSVRSGSRCAGPLMRMSRPKSFDGAFVCRSKSGGNTWRRAVGERQSDLARGFSVVETAHR